MSPSSTLCSIFFALALVVTSTMADHPIGSTGCSGRKIDGTNGRCWRYCSGSDGAWCYTGGGGCRNGKNGDECSYQTVCEGYTCDGAMAGCVRSCPARDESSSTALVPHGATGCSEKFHDVNGLCWRYCSGTSGAWCYTEKDCTNHEETCAAKRSCGGQSCAGAGSGCVEACEQEQPITSLSPVGSTGCSGRKLGGENGRCWRYCSGSNGAWCYTGGGGCRDGKNGDECSYKTNCEGYSCDGAMAGCVRSCPAPDESAIHPPVPRGSTGCSQMYHDLNGLCWRYCNGTSGPWCYTEKDCTNHEERCAAKTSCGGQTCTRAMAGCVEACEEEIEPDVEPEGEVYYVTYIVNGPEH